jgi:glyoxylase-like metal-dependent hydrolase (beta-lactamase superfamily II)
MSNAKNGCRNDRREFLKTALTGVAGVSVASLIGTTAFAKAKSEAIAINPIADGVALVTGAGTNVVLVTGPEGVVMIDGGTMERSGDLLSAVGKHAQSKSKGARTVALFNTHWHWDHTGSNERVGKAGTKIIAHENTKLWLGADFTVAWENRDYKPRPKVALPTDTFFGGKRTFDFGSRKLNYGWLPRAHTDGDIYVHIPDQNVLVTGDLVSVGSYPILDVDTGGWLGGMVDANKALLELCDDKTVIVPGSGAVQTKADLAAQLQMLSTMRERLVGLIRKGMGTDDVLAAPPTGEFDAKWGDPRLFLANAYRGLFGHVRELGGIV